MPKSSLKYLNAIGAYVFKAEVTVVMCGCQIAALPKEDRICYYCMLNVDRVSIQSIDVLKHRSLPSVLQNSSPLNFGINKCRYSELGVASLNLYRFLFLARFFFNLGD